MTSACLGMIVFCIALGIISTTFNQGKYSLIISINAAGIWGVAYAILDGAK